MCASRTIETKVAYRKTCRRLIEQFRQEHENDNLVEFISWLIDNKNRGLYAKSTWRQYKNAVLAYLKEDSPQRIAQCKRLREETSEGARRKGGQGKVKNISKAALRYLDKVVDAHTHPKTAHRIKVYFTAAEITGLRPVEWDGVTLNQKDGRCILSAFNAKDTNERAHGEMRHIEILGPERIAAVTAHFDCLRDYLEESALINGRGHKGANRARTPGDYCAAISRALERAYAKALTQEQARGLKTRPPTLCLYSARHQFKNHARKAGLPPIEIAYLMGHASIETHQRHYGQRRSRSGSFGVQRAARMPQVLLDNQKKVETKRVALKTKRNTRKMKPR